MVAAARVLRAPATVAGLFDAPCDPLILAVGPPDGPLPGLTARVDWRLAGALRRLLASAAPGPGEPLLVPATPLLPAGRLLLFPATASATALAECVLSLGASPVGLAPADFNLAPESVQAALGARAWICYGAA